MYIFLVIWSRKLREQYKLQIMMKDRNETIQQDKGNLIHKTKEAAKSCKFVITRCHQWTVLFYNHDNSHQMEIALMILPAIGLHTFYNSLHILHHILVIWPSRILSRLVYISGKEIKLK